MTNPNQIWTIGHSTRTLDEFIALLKQHSITALADVRRHPGSRRLPQFGSEALAATLPEQGIHYQWIPELGGRRRATRDSINNGWRNSSFKGYADHMASAEFAHGIEQLTALAQQQPTAMMCAELLWWRCHRSLVSDLFKFRGWQVHHIQDATHLNDHPYTAPARDVDGQLLYPAAGGEPLAEPKRGRSQLSLDL